MSSGLSAQRGQVRSEPGGEARQSLLAFVSRILLVILLVAAFLFLFKRSTRLEPELQAVLDGEEEALRAGDWGEFAALLDPDHAPFRQHQKAQFDAVMSARRRGESYVGIPYPLHVVEAGRRDDRAWARVSGEGPDGQPFYRVEFFRQLYGDWLHTGPNPAWWGAEREEHTAHVVWRYREAEEAWITEVAPFMEAAHARACADLGLDPRRSVVTFDLCYSIDCNHVLFYTAGPSISLPAPLLAGWSGETAAEVLPGIMVGNLLARAMGSGSDPNVSVGNVPAWMDGIRLWETGRVTGIPGSEFWLTELRTAAADGSFLSLDAMAYPPTPDTYSLLYAQSYALVEYLVARHGPGVLPALVRAAVPSNTPRETIEEAFGPDFDLAAFEQEWMAWMQAEYGQ
ncbi:MAG TPA: hypothetical protein VLC95_10100 [Anaerolineae bacterium]|nr:hypothetical protein [Anaerolineae bacterium]